MKITDCAEKNTNKERAIPGSNAGSMSLSSKKTNPPAGSFSLKAFAKINLTLDVLGVLENGYHELSMIMQQILLCDDVLVRWLPEDGRPFGDAGDGRPFGDAGDGRFSGASGDGRFRGASDCIRIVLSTNKRYLPTDERNLAYKAAASMADRFGRDLAGTIRIDIKKRIPVAAGLAGGSSNAAAVLHALNKLWSLDLDLAALCETGKELGSDIPFCIMGQSAGNESLRDAFRDDPLSCHCALATGTGTDLLPITGLKSHLVLSKPNIGVSTAEVYRGIDSMTITVHPDNEEMLKALEEDKMLTALRKNNRESIQKNLINVLENFTLKRYPIVMYTKDMLRELCSTDCVLMSGSGPTVFGLCKNSAEARAICKKLLEHNRESFWTRTTW